MHLTLRQLQIFVAVATTGSTASAADNVALSQSATSAALNELENLLNHKLFDRVGKRLVLNDNGRLLLPQAQWLLNAANEIERQFTSNDIQLTFADLQIGASTTIGTYLLPTMLASLIADSSSAQPKVTIANTAEVAALAVNFEVDIGLVEGPVSMPELQVEPWLLDELIIVAAPSHPVVSNKSRRKVGINALRNAHWLMREPGSGTRESVENALLPHLHHLRSGGEFNNSEAIKYAAAEGLGLACLSRFVVRDLIAMGRLVELKTEFSPIHRQLYLTYNRKKVLSKRLAYLLKYCHEWSRKISISSK
jgi:DNA-binding transcriptional LysR family regulator